MTPRERDPGNEDHQRPRAPEQPGGREEGDPERDGSDNEDGDESDEEIEIPPDPIHEATMARLRAENEFLLRQQEEEDALLRREIALRDQIFRDVQRMEERHRELMLQREQREQQDQESGSAGGAEERPNTDRDVTGETDGKDPEGGSASSLS